MRPVDRDALAHRATEQLIDRHAERLALDVEQRVFDRGDGARIDPAGRLHLTHPQHRGDLLHRSRVEPDQWLGQAVDHAGQAAAAIGLGVFRPADQAVIGGELEERKSAPAGVAVQVLDLGEFHDVALLAARWQYQADAAQMAEQLLQPVAVRLRQRRPQNRLDVRAQVRLVAGAEQHDIDAGLMAHIAIRRIGQAGGAAWMDQEAERVGMVGQRLRHLALRCQFLHRFGHAVGAGEDAAHGEHQQRADAMFQSCGEHGLAGVLAHQVERDHDDIPDAVGDGAQQHLVFEIVRRGLGDAEEAEFALFLFLQQGRCDHVMHVVVAGGRHRMELKDIDAVDAEFAQRVVEAGDDTFRRPAFAAADDGGLGGDHHAIARHGLDCLADHALGVIGRGGVEQVDALVERGMDDRDGAGLGAAGVQTQPAETAAAETGDADPEFRPAQRGVFHAPTCSLKGSRLAGWRWDATRTRLSLLTRGRRASVNHANDDRGRLADRRHVARCRRAFR